jgi:hypothetical protein
LQCGERAPAAGAVVTGGDALAVGGEREGGAAVAGRPGVGVGDDLVCGAQQRIRGGVTGARAARP